MGKNRRVLASRGGFWGKVVFSLYYRFFPFRWLLWTVLTLQKGTSNSQPYPSARYRRLRFSPLGYASTTKTSTPPRDCLRFPILTPFSAAPLRMTSRGKNGKDATYNTTVTLQTAPLRMTSRGKDSKNATYSTPFTLQTAPLNKKQATPAKRAGAACNKKGYDGERERSPIRPKVIRRRGTSPTES